MELAALIVSSLTFALFLSFFFTRRSRQDDAHFDLVRKQLEDLRSEVGKDVESVREQSRTSFEQTAKLLGQELRASREELAKTAKSLREEVDKKLGETITKNVQNFSAVTDKLGQLQKATGQIVELSQGIHDLNVLLKTPTGRGSFGEMTLEQMLGDLFGEHTDMYETQYEIEEGKRVDAAIFVRPDKSQVLCVDSKFPLANATPLVEGTDDPVARREFGKDVRARAEEIEKKYIRPGKTLDFAFMFVPSEAVYYQLLADAKLHESLLKKKVIPTSPNSFFAYLQALSAAFRGIKIEKKTKEIQKAIQLMAQEFARFRGDYDRMGTHLRNTAKVYEDADKRLERLRTRMDKINEGEVPPPLPAETTKQIEEK